MPTSTKTLNLSVPAGSTLTVTGATIPSSGSVSCTNAAGNAASIAGVTYNTVTNKTTQVLSLRNGDTPPVFAPLGSQPPIDAYLTKYLDPATGKIKLAENQVIFLFELGTTINPSAPYDMQDLVVLATIAPQ